MSGRAAALRTPDGMIPALRARLAQRVEHIEAEAELLRAAMLALDAPAARRPQSGANARSVQDVILQALAEVPGSRASMLAVATGLRSAHIASALAALESEQQVSRDGLGWSLTAPAAGGRR